MKDESAEIKLERPGWDGSDSEYIGGRTLRSEKT